MSIFNVVEAITKALVLSLTDELKSLQVGLYLEPQENVGKYPFIILSTNAISQKRSFRASYELTFAIEIFSHSETECMELAKVVQNSIRPEQLRQRVIEISSVDLEINYFTMAQVNFERAEDSFSLKAKLDYRSNVLLNELDL